MKFDDLLKVEELKSPLKDYVWNHNSPYGKEMTSVSFLNNNYRECQDIDDCIEKTSSNGLTAIFEYIKNNDLLN